MAGWKDKVKEAAAKGAEAAKQAKEQYDAAAEKRMAEATAGGPTPLAQVESKDEGRNAVVSVFPDRIERVKAKSMASLSKAAQDAEVIPLSKVSHVKAEKKGLKTVVTIVTAGEDIVLRCAHDQASTFKNAVTNAMMARENQLSPGTAAPAAAADGPAEQIKKLGDLRDQGLLTDEEFEAKKKQILGL